MFPGTVSGVSLRTMGLAGSAPDKDRDGTRPNGDAILRLEQRFLAGLKYILRRLHAGVGKDVPIPTQRQAWA